MRRGLITFCLLGMVFLFSCKRTETDVAVQSCTVDYNYVDTSYKHPKHAVYTQMMQQLTQAGMPGISMMIEDESGMWYGSSGFADLHNQIPMQTCHLGKIASVTKLFTAVMIYKLAEQGKLSLEDPISQYIDEKHIQKIKNAELAKVKDLLSHSSGIYDVVFDSEFILYTFNNLDKEKSYEKLLSFAYHKSPSFEYNTKHDYNQTLNHTLLAMIINRVTGSDQVDYLQKEIIQPLQMQHTFIRPQQDLPWEQVAKGYYDYRKEGVLQDLTPLYTGDGRGFTGIYSTVNDLRKFTTALFKNKTLLQSSSYNQMVSIAGLDTTLACAGGCRAMQIQVNGQNYTWYGHPGGEVNYAAGAFYCPEKKATLTFTVNYGVAFTEMGAYTDAYFDFRRKIFYEIVK